MFCEKCGNKLQDGERFCPVCGNRVGGEDSLSESEFSYGIPNEDLHSDYDDQVRDPKQEYDSDVTLGMGYGYGEPDGGFQDQEPSRKKKTDRRKNDDIDDEWEKEEKKEKITFIILGVIIIMLVIAIVAGVVFLVKSGEDKESERVPQLNEEMKEELQQSKKEPETTEEPTEEPTPEATPEPTEEATPEPTQEATPVPTQEVTPVPTQEVTPVPTQQVTPAPTQAPTANTSNDYVIPDSSTRYLTNADLNPLSEWEVRIARNEIYARHGRIFKTEELASYFEGKSWYKGTISPENFDNSYLSSIEIENLKFITNYEKAHNLNQ